MRAVSRAPPTRAESNTYAPLVQEEVYTAHGVLTIPQQTGADERDVISEDQSACWDGVGLIAVGVTGNMLRYQCSPPSPPPPPPPLPPPRARRPDQRRTPAERESQREWICPAASRGTPKHCLVVPRSGACRDIGAVQGAGCLQGHTQSAVCTALPIKTSLVCWWQQWHSPHRQVHPNIPRRGVERLFCTRTPRCDPTTDTRRGWCG
jgi:hypothetical protein